MSVVVFAYHDVGCAGLRALVDCGIDVALVHTHADDPDENVWFGSVRQTALELGIDVSAGADPHDRRELARLRDLAPDAIFSFYYRDLLRDDVLATARHGGANLHGSLLPRYRGRAPVNWQILHGETCGGVTLHRMVRRADAGDVIDSQRVPIDPDDTPIDVYRRLIPAARQVVLRSANAVADGTAVAARQLESNATTFPRRRPADGRIDWNVAAHDVRNLIRAVTHPYPGAFTFAGDRRLTVWWADRPSAAPDATCAPGSIRRDRDGAFVQCGDGRALRLTRVEIDGVRLEGTALLHGLDGVASFRSEPKGMPQCTF
jgi:UDP-4-amino-4-deoxy-L-arabinose formyltransferase/UDP-glucuronic acid dehydrogenase (UDP-4-keto-hexauronic acid decarboxylating)